MSEKFGMRKPLIFTTVHILVSKGQKNADPGFEGVLLRVDNKTPKLIEKDLEKMEDVIPLIDNRSGDGITPIFVKCGNMYSTDEKSPGG